MDSTSLTLSQIESHLWEAANILRGPVDAADFKTYVFPLLFFKRVSDVHDEEYRAALDESGGDEKYALFPQDYRFQIPDGCHWSDVRNVTTNVGQALQKAMRGIEKENREMDPREGETLYDPACGTGGMLLEAIHRVRERHGDDRTLWGSCSGRKRT